VLQSHLGTYFYNLFYFEPIHYETRFSEACDCHGVSSEAAADIINAYATDMGLLTPENKLNRWWKAGRTKTNAKQIEEIGSKPITGFYLMVRRIQLSPKCKRETSPIQSH